MNLLLVDDEATMLRMMKLVLQANGFQVFDAPNGAAALALAQNHPIDVLVTDIVMKEMDGLTLARSLTERNPGLSVVFISGYPMNFDAKSIHATCTFLLKPFGASELVNTTLDLCKGGSTSNCETSNHSSGQDVPIGRRLVDPGR